MSRPFWLRPLRIAEKPGENVARAAAHHEPLESLLRIGAACLLESLNADRAGVWAEQGPGEAVWKGQIAQIESLGSENERCNVNAYEVFPVEFNDAQAPLEFFAPVFPVGPREFFEGISTAVGVPLRVGDRILGAALAGSVRAGRMAWGETLENIAAEIAVALYTSRIREEQEQTNLKLQLQAEIERLLASGATTHDVLSRILSAAVRQTSAQFVGVVRRLDSSLQWEALAGAPPADHFCDALFRIATAVFLDREAAVRDIPAGLSPGLSVAALPLGFSEAGSLVFLAGYLAGDRIALEALEGFCAMAANARAVSNARDADSAYRSMFDSMSEALVVTDRTGRVMEANRYAREMLLWKGELGSGIGIGEFFVRPGRDEFELWCSQAASAARVPMMKAQLENGLQVRLALRQVLGGSRNLLLRLEEATIIERAERHWKQIKAELCSVFDAVQCGVVLVSTDGRIRFINARFGVLFGVDPYTLQSLETIQELANLVAPRFRIPESFGTPWNSFVAGSRDAVHDEMETTMPSARALERYARPVLSDEGMSLGWLEVFWDVTARRQMQSKLLQTEKMAAVGQLASGIAHELSNPLTSIMGYAQLLLGEKPRRGHGEEAKMIFDEAERARRIVKNLLSFARPAKTERTRADINEIIERAIALREYELKLRNIEVKRELQSGLPPTMADPNQLQQVVLNLIVNAEQAIAENQSRGIIVVRSRQTSTQRIVIEVCDSGPGIPAEISSRIFDLFFTTKAPGVGTGLGLAIVRSIVERHNGEVSFENLSSGGAKFTVQLPLLAVPASQTALVKEDMLSIAVKHRGARILVVEDEPTVARLIEDVLREEGHEVESVLDSREGLRRLSETAYDLVICDLRMPHLDGPALYDALVRAGSTARHRILFVTGDTLGPHTVEFLQARQLQFLAKPFLVEELKLAVYRALDRDTATAAANLASVQAHG